MIIYGGLYHGRGKVIGLYHRCGEFLIFTTTVVKIYKDLKLFYF